MCFALGWASYCGACSYARLGRDEASLPQQAYEHIVVLEYGSQCTPLRDFHQTTGVREIRDLGRMNGDLNDIPPVRTTASRIYWQVGKYDQACRERYLSRSTKDH